MRKFPQRCGPAALYPWDPYYSEFEAVRAQGSAEVMTIFFHRVGRLVPPPEQRDHRLGHRESASAAYLRDAHTKPSLDEDTISPQENCQ
jgi:hypothetical protein